MVLRASGITIWALALISAPCGAAERHALVVGNGAYTNIAPLSNPPNDARLVSDAFRDVGFQVTTLIDADKRTMEDAARKFAQQLDEAGTNAVGVFYFAGHGVTHRGENWLLPVKAPIKSGVDVEYEAVSATRVLKLMEQARNATDILILDACRDSPFRGFSLSGTRSLSGGMAEMKAPAGSFIAYSTAPGAVAYDGRGSYSPFAEAFAAEVGATRKSISDMMIDVRKKVKTSTKGLGAEPQTPWDASSLEGHFSFSPSGPATAATPMGGSDGSVQPQPQIIQQPSGPSPEQRYWQTVKDSQDPVEYAAYLKRYPNGEFAEIAKARQQRYSKPSEPEPRTSNMNTAPGSSDSAGAHGSGADPQAVAFCRQFAGADSYADCLVAYEDSGDDWDLPDNIRPWDDSTGYPPNLAGGQTTGATMIWYDDARNQWQVTTGPAGFSATGMVAGFGQMALQGQSEGYGLTYTIHDGSGRQIGYGQGTITDQSHIAVTSYYPDGTVMGSGRFHVNHPPN